MLASAGDDGNVLLWVPSELQTQSGLGEDRSDDKETWRVKHMCRSSGAEIYDLAWSPDGVFFITGSMDNIARIYNAQTGQMVRQIAEHSHYVQGVAWDPLNEFVATQSSDRSVHIYSLKTKDGQFTLTSHGKFLRMDLPARRIPSTSPAPPDLSGRAQPATSNPIAISPVPSTPGTPLASNLPMDPPPVSHSRRSSFGSSPSIRRSASPVPSLPLPAVKPIEMPSPSVLAGLGVKNSNIYANETLTSFFRRLTFTPDGSLLFTPAGQYKTSHVSAADPAKTTDEITNTVYIYTRAGFNKPPISHLPGHKKPSVAVKCSPVFYTLKQGVKPANHIVLDTSSGEDAFPSLPDSVVSSSTNPSMEPPSSMSATNDASKPPPSKSATNEGTTSGQGSPTFALPYRIVYAVATQDAVYVYDTQQQTPLCVVSNLHFATFTDLTWSNDGLTLIMSSSDGFCSTLSFSPGELGQPYTGPTSTPHTHAVSSASSTNNNPLPTPTHQSPIKSTSTLASPVPSQPSSVAPARPATPARTNSAASVATSASAHPSATVVNNPTPILGSVPLVTAINSSQPPALPITSPPQTPMSAVSQSKTSSVSGSVLGKRDMQTASESEKEETKNNQGTTVTLQQPKKRRIAPTLISTNDTSKASDRPDGGG
ncbi:hypothetical protein MAP00_009031 [Monascus purpureus]|nr:hypothetical protein MAP00_009031 [Monascus purpureus]